MGTGMMFVRGNLMERFQYKFPPVHIHMRYAQVVLFQNQVVIEDDIQIQRPRSPMDGTLSSGILFDSVQHIQ